MLGREKTGREAVRRDTSARARTGSEECGHAEDPVRGR